MKKKNFFLTFCSPAEALYIAYKYGYSQSKFERCKHFYANIWDLLYVEAASQAKKQNETPLDDNIPNFDKINNFILTYDILTKMSLSTFLSSFGIFYHSETLTKQLEDNPSIIEASLKDVNSFSFYSLLL